MRRKNLTASAVLVAVLFAGCGGSDKSTRSLETTTLGDSVGLSTKSVATTQQTTEVQTVSTKNTLQTGTSFTITKDIKKDTVIGKVESGKLDGEILSLSLCGDYANYFSIDENGTLKLECDLPEDFEEVTLKVKADVKKDGECKNTTIHIKITKMKNILASSNDPFNDGSLIAKYLFDGDTNDLLNKHNGLGTNITYVDGKFGQGAMTNGQNNEVTTSFVFKNKFLTYSFWAKPTQNFRHYQFILGSAKDTYSYMNFSFYLDFYNNKLAVVSSPLINSETINPDDSINHYVVEVDHKTGNYKWFTNGKFMGKGQNNYFKTIKNGAELKFLSFDNFDNSYARPSILDHLEIFNRALTKEEVLKLYNAK